ncbi:MAG TPA: hypothetical protein VK858_21535 [Longimicrobiales bacterium]|nr:hypothetical protein [Longimicrobiales bacterium]
MYTLVRRFIKTGIAFLFLGLGAWMRIRPVGSHIREARGERF